MKKTHLQHIDIYQFEQLANFSNLKQFVSCKNSIGENFFSLSLSSVKNPVPVIKNRELFAKELNISTSAFVFQQQEHTRNVTVVKKEHAGKGFYDHLKAFTSNDAMITSEKGICLMIMGADCVPLLFYDPIKRIIGAAHAGWRGTEQQIAIETVKSMQENFGCQPKDILATIGPSISAENYEVDQIVYKAFANSHNNINEIFTTGKKTGKYQLDLWKANRIQLLSTGIKASNIETAGICTFKNNQDFFSARKGDSGRFASGIMML